MYIIHGRTSKNRIIKVVIELQIHYSTSSLTDSKTFDSEDKFLFRVKFDKNVCKLCRMTRIPF